MAIGLYQRHLGAAWGIGSTCLVEVHPSNVSVEGFRGSGSEAVDYGVRGSAVWANSLGM